MQEQAAGLLGLVCAKIGGDLNTAALYRRADLERVRDAKLMLHCGFCRETHLFRLVFRFADARLKPTDDNRPPPSGVSD